MFNFLKTKQKKNVEIFKNALEKINDENDITKILCVNGMLGIGKTTFIKRFFKKNKNFIYVPLSSISNIEKIKEKIILDYNINNSIFRNIFYIINIFLKLINKYNVLEKILYLLTTFLIFSFFYLSVIFVNDDVFLYYDYNSLFFYIININFKNLHEFFNFSILDIIKILFWYSLFYLYSYYFVSFKENIFKRIYFKIRNKLFLNTHIELVSNQIICIDNLETRNKDINLKEIFDLILYFKENYNEKKCKIILVFDREDLRKEKVIFEEYFNKIIDEYITFEKKIDLNFFKSIFYKNFLAPRLEWWNTHFSII